MIFKREKVGGGGGEESVRVGWEGGGESVRVGGVEAGGIEI